jgi:hypothetical protein
VLGPTSRSEVLNRGFNGRLEPNRHRTPGSRQALLLYPRPRQVYEQQSEGPLLDLTDAAVKRMIRLAKTRGYVTYDELNEVLPPEEFTREQIEDVLGQLYEMGITAVEAEEDHESPPAAAAEGQEKRVEHSQLAALAIYSSVFEGCWDGRGWRTSVGLPCEPTHWMPMPSPPLTLVGR